MSVNYLTKNSSFENSNDISGFILNKKTSHEYNDELTMMKYSSHQFGSKKKKFNGFRENSNEGPLKRNLHMYREIDSEEISNIRLENRNRMAMRETQNPILQFFKLILVKLGCSEQ